MPIMGPKTMTVLVVILVVIAITSLIGSIAANIKVGTFKAGVEV